MKTVLRAAVLSLLVLLPIALKAQTATRTPPQVPGSAKFDKVADKALLAMRKKAEELNIQGAALVAYFEGDSIQSWSSRMVVVGSFRKEPKDATDPGSNVLAFAYQKASEMANTLKNSGTKPYTPMKGELGWEGGVIVRGKNGYLIAAFSGGKSEDDVKVSHAGVEALQTGL
jgi:hypothetical protein